METMGEALKMIRGCMGLSGVEVAEALGINPGRVTDHEKGTRNVTLKMLSNYADTYGVSEALIMTMAKAFADCNNRSVLTRHRLIKKLARLLNT